MDSNAKPIEQFKHLINHVLPSTYIKPVRFNHCFNRIILDWLYKDCWYNHLDKNNTAISQLNDQQLNKAILRMKDWLKDQQLLIDDNNASLIYRKKSKYNSMFYFP